MPVAVLHNEFTPYGGRGGVCATGEIIIGPHNNGSDSWALGRFVVVDPTGPLKTRIRLSETGGGEPILESVGRYSHGAEFAALGVTTDSDAYRIGEDLFMFARLVVTDGGGLNGARHGTGGALTSTAYYDMTPVWAFANTYSLQPTTAGEHEGVSVTAMWADIGG